MGGSADLRHPFAEPCHRDFAADNDERDKHPDAVEREQRDDRRADKELIGDRIQKRPHRRGEIVFPRDIAIERVSDGRHAENHARDHVLGMLAEERNIKNADNEGDERDTGPGERHGHVKAFSFLRDGSGGGI